MRLSLFTAILCCIMKVFTIVKGQYQAEITLYQYNNTPPGKCHGCNNVLAKDQSLHQGCCDDPPNNGTCIGGDLCDVYFTYCLRPFGSTGRGCYNYMTVTSSVKNDTSSFRFPQQNMSLNVLGLPNPLLLPGLTDNYTSEGVQLYIEIWDADPPNAKPDELVDILLIDHNESVGEESTTQVHSGIYGFVSMKLMITVNCIENFQGADCSQCVPGFTGPDCQQIDNCVGINCSGNGQCLDGEDSFNCNCDPGFTGELCQINILECVGVNCSENGQCVDGVNSFFCNCDPGFTGELCQTNIDECVGVGCSGNGECLDEVNSFTCECSTGYTGPLCDIQVSSSSFAGSFVGGIVGGVIGAILVVIILIVIPVLVVTQNKKQAGTSSHEKQRGFRTLPGNNPVYELQEGNIQVYTSPGFHYEITGPEKDQERGCGNQVTGIDVTSGPVHTTPSVSKTQESTLKHKFDNIIYGCEPERNTYSVFSGPSATTSSYDTVTDKER